MESGEKLESGVGHRIYHTHTSSIVSWKDNVLSGAFLISSMSWDPWTITIHLSSLGTRKIEPRYLENYLILKLRASSMTSQWTTDLVTSSLKDVSGFE